MRSSETMIPLQEVMQKLEEEFERIHGIKPTTDKMDELIKQYREEKEEYMKDGFTEEEAELLAIATVVEKMELERMRHDMGL